MTNKEVVKRFYETAFGKKDAKGSSELLAADFMHNGVKRGREGQAGAVQYFLTAFPDMEHKIEMIFCEGDYVTARQSWKGTHGGEFMGVPATGRTVTFESTAILKVEGGLITEAWDAFDTYEIFKQMGAVPLS